VWVTAARCGGGGGVVSRVHASDGTLLGQWTGAPAPSVGHRIGEWHPLAPVLVAEVQFDHVTGGRFRQVSEVEA
jgi:hypothetical protein